MLEKRIPWLSLWESWQPEGLTERAIVDKSIKNRKICYLPSPTSLRSATSPKGGGEFLF